jgi:hypothetical protein
LRNSINIFQYDSYTTQIGEFCRITLKKDLNRLDNKQKKMN